MVTAITFLSSCMIHICIRKYKKRNGKYNDLLNSCDYSITPNLLINYKSG
jgi:hypothetical protein